MYKTHLITLFFLFLFSSVTHAQSRYSLRTNFGTASGTKAVEGYYYSFDFGIPLFQGLELAPTFTSASTLSSGDLDISWNKEETGLQEEKLLDYSNKMNSDSGGDILNSVSLLLLLKPLELFGNNSRHEIALGAGVSYHSHSSISAKYKTSGDGNELSNLYVETTRGFAPYYAKVFYNYHLRKRTFIGVVASVDGMDTEGIALFGIQLGVNL